VSYIGFKEVINNFWKLDEKWITQLSTQLKARQRCVMGVGMCLYAQLVQTKNK